MGSPRRHAVPPLLSLGGALALLLAVAGAAALAADPSAGPSASEPAAPLPSAAAAPARPGPVGNIQAWLDAEFITPDAPPGGVLQAGFTFWDPRAREFFQVGGIYVRLHPATGKAAPSEGTIQVDFPGHVVAVLVVPAGGPGDVEVGVHSQVCTDPGGCKDQDLPFAIAGVGPPSDATAEQLVGATIHPLVGDTVAGREFPVSVDVVPPGMWDFASLPLPDHLVVIARHPGGAELSTGELRPGTQPGRLFTGKLKIPETGKVELVVAIPTSDGNSLVIDGSTMTVTVVEGGRRESPGAAASQVIAAPSGLPSQEASSDGVPTFVWVLGIGAVLVVGFLVARRYLSDL